MPETLGTYAIIAFIALCGIGALAYAWWLA
jgi:hypothetical protein